MSALINHTRNKIARTKICTGAIFSTKNSLLSALGLNRDFRGKTEVINSLSYGVI
jgi:hypothetical protein